jgi:hypothetical protein
MDCRTALLTLLDQVDYTAGNCRPNEMVGGVLPKEIIAMCRKAAEQGVHPTLLESGQKMVVCPRCALMFDIELPKPQSG